MDLLVLMLHCLCKILKEQSGHSLLLLLTSAQSHMNFPDAWAVVRVGLQMTIL